MTKRKMKKNSATETAMPLPIEEIITDIGSCVSPLLDSKLAELSNPDPEELELFKRLWAKIEPERRRQTVHRMVELAENNFELNFDSILKHCLTDEDDEVRSTAIEGLWENEEASLISPLISLLEQDSSEKVQEAAATALGKFAMLAEHKKLRSCHVSSIEESLLAVINDKNKPVGIRCRAMEAVAPLSLPQVKTAITEAYQSHNHRLRVSAIYAMGKNCDPSRLPILLKELGNSDVEMRYEATGACSELEEEEAVPHLIKLFNDIDTDVRIAAIQAAGKIGGTQAKKSLEQCLNHPSEAISQAAKQALLELEAKEDPLSLPIRNAL